MSDTPEVAKKAQLVSLAQYVVAVDGTKVCEGLARSAFAVTQEAAARILTDALREYPFPPVDLNEPRRSE
ncbi:MAG: hypothetical protein WAK16_04015 [Candidatus Cybelea sp.]